MPPRRNRSRRAPQARPDLTLRPSQGAWLLATSTGDSAQILNLTTALIWSYCDGRHEPRAIVAAVEAELPPELRNGSLDLAVSTTLEQWASQGLLV